MKVASLPHRLGWEDTTIPIRAAVANDAIPRFTDEPWAQALSECRGHLEEAVPPSSSLITGGKIQLTAPEGPKVPGEDRTQGFMFTRRQAGEVAETMGFSFSLR
ncbi:uncharacterized [Lates japonicus]